MIYEEVIYGRTVRLRAVEVSDAEITYKMRSDPKKSHFIHAAKGTVEDQRNYIISQRAKHGDYLFIIEDLEGDAIGMKGVYDYDPENKTVETGRYLSYGTQVQNIEALYLSFDFAFDVLSVDNIIMSALETNTVMRGIQDKFGVVVTHNEFLDEFGCNNVFTVLTKEKYGMTKPKIEKLVERFANR